MALDGMSFAQTTGSTDAIENVGQGKINWTIGEVYATGIGAPPSRAMNPAQARAMAERAATVVALRNLLEIIKGVQIDSETVIENFMTKSDIVRSRISGIVRGAIPVGKRYLSDGSVEITVGMKMKGEFLNVVVPHDFGGQPILPAPTVTPSEPSQQQRPRPAPSPPAPPIRQAPQPPLSQEKPSRPETPAPSALPGPATAQFKGGKATGVVIDGKGLGLRPALLPKIIDEQGREIYVGQVVTRTNAVEQGVAGYAKDVNAAANNFRVTDNPVVLKGIRASGSTKTDIVLSGRDAQTLRDLSRQGDFLQYCRVIIVY